MLKINVDRYIFLNAFLQNINIDNPMIILETTLSLYIVNSECSTVTFIPSYPVTQTAVMFRFVSPLDIEWFIKR